ncbi:hypothetical protein [Actinoplanes utahensis]|nr:hypothetical protein [Actinoplanes utahensis]GIF32353.1 hypothetical protein Aut01nite_53390 [Actinoplanes utahensis]
MSLVADGVDVRQTEDDLTLVLSAAGAEVMRLRVRYEGWDDEVINPAGAAAPGPGAFTLIGHELRLEFGARTVADVGYARDCRVRLDVDDEGIRRVRAALLEILQCACYIVDTAEGRVCS